MKTFEDAVRARSSEVDSLAAELVEQGYSPWDAMEEASRRVDRQRRAKKEKPRPLSEYLKGLQNP